MALLEAACDIESKAVTASRAAGHSEVPVESAEANEGVQFKSLAGWEWRGSEEGPREELEQKIQL